MTHIDYLIWDLVCLVITGIVYFALKNSRSKDDE